MRSPARVSVSLAVVALLASIALAVPRVEAAPAEITGDVPSGGGLALIVWGGGDTTQLRAAASYGGCDLQSTWITVAGAFAGYIFGAPAPVNATFIARFPGGALPESTPMVLRCVATTPTPRPPTTPTPAVSPTAAPTSTTLRFSRADSGSETVTGENTGLLGLVLAAADTSWDPASRRMRTWAAVPNVGVNEKPSATVRLWNDFTTAGTAGQAATAQVSVSAAWAGTLAGTGVAGTGASIEIVAALLDRADGNRVVASRVVHSKEQRESALSAGGVGDSGSGSVDFTAQVVRGRAYRLQLSATCEATSGLLGSAAACGFAPLTYVVVRSDGYVDWTEATVTY